MRKLLLSIGVLCMAFGPAASVGADPGTYLDYNYSAFADWIELDGKTGVMHVAYAYRFLHEEKGLVTRAIVAKGKCRVSKAGGWTMISCRGRGVSKFIPLEDFSVHPLFDSAELDVKAGGYSNHVTWTGRGRTPHASEGVSVGDGYAYAGAYVYRDAKGSGTVLGDEVRTNGWLDWCDMSVSAFAFAHDGLADRGFEIDTAPDGTFMFERTVRFRH
jgi:hypothetical protein